VPKTAIATEEWDVKVAILRLIELRIAYLRWLEVKENRAA
jgi:hypothetical protein